MDELSEEDKLTVNRARKVQRFFSQPFSVAEQFTGTPGKYVPLKETVRGFREILEGKYDDVPENLFLMAGSIDEVAERYEAQYGGTLVLSSPGVRFFILHIRLRLRISSAFRPYVRIRLSILWS